MSNITICWNESELRNVYILRGTCTQLGFNNLVAQYPKNYQHAKQPIMTNSAEGEEFLRGLQWKRMQILLAWNSLPTEGMIRYVVGFFFQIKEVLSLQRLIQYWKVNLRFVCLENIFLSLPSCPQCHFQFLKNDSFFPSIDSPFT